MLINFLDEFRRLAAFWTPSGQNFEGTGNQSINWSLWNVIDWDLWNGIGWDLWAECLWLPGCFLNGTLKTTSSWA
ncbi:unnamed protein product [Rhizophagus irregularis]|nr:unnamed protein product [Rhizophagus irregularis]